jgi:hypothetical protein
LSAVVVMETQFGLFPTVEPIGRKPFLKKWIHKKSITPSPDVKGFEFYLEDIYRFLFQILEHQNLELAYRFRFTVEAAGTNPFLKRQVRLDKALKRARNKAYYPMEKLLDEIQLEVGLDFDTQLPGFGLTVPLHSKIDIFLREAGSFDSSGSNETYLTELGKSNNNHREYIEEPEEELEEQDEEFEYRKLSLHSNIFHQLDKIRHITDGDESGSDNEVDNDFPEPIMARPVFYLGTDEAPADREKKPEKEPLKDITHSLDSFNLPEPNKEEEEKEAVLHSDKGVKNEEMSGQWKKAGYGKTLGSTPGQEKNEEISRETPEQPVLEHSSTKAPPPLYNFHLKLRKPVSKAFPDEDAPEATLCISSDCIERRSKQASAGEHFLGSSSFWDHFQKQDESRVFRDTTSLIIHQHCINHRIKHTKAPTRHALETSEGEKETFKAFDSIFTDESHESVNNPLTNSSDATEILASTPGEIVAKELDEEQIFLKIKKELFQESLNTLNQKDGTLFDYLSGKISIDEADKHEIGKWVRNQHSVPTEIYRTFSEAVMQADSGAMVDIQKQVRMKLHENDFPSSRVRKIFNRLKETSKNTILDRTSLIRLLKRQDYICEAEAGSESKTTISFSRAYSRYRDWRSSVESPKIEVRTTDISQRQDIIPSENPCRTWHFLDPPKIEVRTSSDYRKKQTLPVIDKISNWKKTKTPKIESRN